MASLFSRTVACAALVLAGVVAPATTSQAATAPVGFECESEGFHGDPDEPQKFHRCVDFGDGTFTQFDFWCSPGTIWDQSLTTCNHPWAVSPGQ
ncbi:chitin binding domain-containing protein [Streptomyces antibioticus]|uniref:Chitin binding domain-containing protein n=1 Tax=Streptomyces antibioticus TaxID=1890 RepID=A0AAE6Y3T7_STRAT|nr:chitin binding domain-containing protein [Streptomyces antibioticus]